LNRRIHFNPCVNQNRTVASNPETGQPEDLEFQDESRLISPQIRF
jgi:hypothetical protein